jgi:hypothetical protein
MKLRETKLRSLMLLGIMGTFVCAAPFATTQRAQAQSGKPYVSKAGAFLVLLTGPASPIQRQQEGITARGVASPVPQGNGVCMVIYFNWRETKARFPSTNADKQAFLNESSTGFMRGAQAKLIKQRALVIQGKQARELIFEVPALKFTGKAHVILSEDRVYQVVRLTPKGKAIPAAAERFMKNFQVL